MTIVYDSEDVQAIPADAQGFLGYIDNSNGTPSDNFDQLCVRFPNAARKTITRSTKGTPGADICDCEPRCCWPPVNAATWAYGEIHAGNRPTIYCSTSNKALVEQALVQFALKLGTTGDVDWFEANYNGSVSLSLGSIGHQYLGYPNGGSPGDYDVSVVSDLWLYGIEEDTMQPIAAWTDPNGLPWYAVRGPDNSLDVYWQEVSGAWNGPLTVPKSPQTVFSAPVVTVGKTGLPTLAVQGPSNSLYVFWMDAQAQWNGPEGIGPPGAIVDS
jgi:hypothetical protein